MPKCHVSTEPQNGHSIIEYCSSRAIGAANGFPKSLVFFTREVEGRGEVHYYDYVYSARDTTGRRDTEKSHGIPRDTKSYRISWDSEIAWEVGGIPWNTVGSRWDTVGYRGSSVVYRGNSVGYSGIPWEVGDIPYTPWDTMVGMCDIVGHRGKSVGYREIVYTAGYRGKSVGYRDIPREVGGIP